MKEGMERGRERGKERERERVKEYYIILYARYMYIHAVHDTTHALIMLSIFMTNKLLTCSKKFSSQVVQVLRCKTSLGVCVEEAV